MGILSDAPPTSRRRGGHGQRFIEFYAAMDDDDRATIRRWRESGMSMVEIADRVGGHWDVARSTVESGVKRLEVAGWDSSQA